MAEPKRKSPLLTPEQSQAMGGSNEAATAAATSMFNQQPTPAPDLSTAAAFRGSDMKPPVQAVSGPNGIVPTLPTRMEQPVVATQPVKPVELGIAGNTILGAVNTGVGAVHKLGGTIADTLESGAASLVGMRPPEGRTHVNTEFADAGAAHLGQAAKQVGDAVARGRANIAKATGWVPAPTTQTPAPVTAAPTPNVAVKPAAVTRPQPADTLPLGRPAIQNPMFAEPEGGIAKSAVVDNLSQQEKLQKNLSNAFSNGTVGDFIAAKQALRAFGQLDSNNASRERTQSDAAVSRENNKRTTDANLAAIAAQEGRFQRTQQAQLDKENEDLGSKQLERAATVTDSKTGAQSFDKAKEASARGMLASENLTPGKATAAQRRGALLSADIASAIHEDNKNNWFSKSSKGVANSLELITPLEYDGSTFKTGAGNIDASKLKPEQVQHMLALYKKRQANLEQGR